MNFKEEVNYEFQTNCQVFLKNIERMILEMFKYNDISLIRNSIVRIEFLINQNHEKFRDLKLALSSMEKDEVDYFSQSSEKRLKVKEYITFLKTLSSLFTFLEENLECNLDEEKGNLLRVNTFLQVLSDFSFKLYDLSNQDYLDSFNVDKILLKMIA
jgi:hypothetical protein